jgi:hypothetical protein
MDAVRRQEQERRVAPIDAGQRPRVRPGGRREQPGAEEEDFAGELARREREEGRAFRQAPEEAPPAGEDTVEIHGRELAEPAPEPPRPDGRHVDLKA